MASTHHRSRHRSRRKLNRQALLALAIIGLLLIAYVMARWLASSTGGFPADPNSTRILQPSQGAPARPA